MLRKAIVVACHPEDHSVDLVMCDDGARLSGVPVMSPNASARSGGVDMPEVPKKADKWDITQRDGQDMEALVAIMGRGNPLVVGFIYPQVSQMTFKDKQRKFQRHQSDVYHTVDGSGNMELYHPSGAYVRIAESPDHEDLEKKNFDENLQLDRNKDKKVHLKIKIGDAFVHITPDGDIEIQGRDIKITATRDMTLKAPTKITMDTPLVVTPNGDMKATDISLKQHKHGGVEPGPGVTGSSVP